MKYILPPMRALAGILGAQSMSAGAGCRLSHHCVQVPQPEGLLLCHTLTGELLLLETGEADQLSQPEELASGVREQLAARWFLRPLEADDCALTDQVRSLVSMLKPREDVITSYTIFTTTKCNARCFYCFEAGNARVDMTAQTARDVAQYIISHCGGREVRIQWFGGEPLMNTAAIDIITRILRAHGVAYRSTMISNGYLFDDAIIARAVEEWQLKWVQITLDGAEEVYNRRKAYVDAQGSPYLRVMDNIQRLLDAGIRVSIRLNMDENNIYDLRMLCDELSQRFSHRSGFGVYLRTLYEDCGTKPPHRSDAERETLCREANALRELLQEKKLAGRPKPMRTLAVNHCIADSDSATTVTPDGHLGCCESYCFEELWGSIYSDEVDEDMIGRWKRHTRPEPACATCPLYPQCVFLEKCPVQHNHCTVLDRTEKEFNLKCAILGAYENWKATQEA